MATDSPVSEWHPSSWRGKKIEQQPTYGDQEALGGILEQVKMYPPLVHMSEIELLRAELARVARGEKFLLQGGDCAERFMDCTQQPIEDKIKILLQMSLVMTYVGHMPVVRIARLAGQYAKPRSSNTEKVDGKEVLSFRGDNVNSFSAIGDRNPDPDRLVSAYFHSAATLNYARAVLCGGFANLRRPEIWDFEYVKDPVVMAEYKMICANIVESLHFFDTLESTASMPESTLRGVNMYISHEGLLLPYEEALTRPASQYGVPSSTGYKYYNSGAHFLWIGDRTRQLDGAHVEYFSGIANPIGIKVGPTTKPEELVKLLDKVNPRREVGRVTLITRCGAKKVDQTLPVLITAVKGCGAPVIWSCDPMHGNTNTVNGYKTRSYDDIFTELSRSFAIHEEMGTILGGVHLEMTGENVTECLGGSSEILGDHLPERYHTYCDPRLNYTQSLDIAFAIAKHHRNSRDKKLKSMLKIGPSL